MTVPRWKKVWLFLTGIIAAAVFLCGLFFLAVTPYALREIWLPAAARSAGVAARAEKICLKSLFPFRIEAVNFHYADSEISLDLSRIFTRIRPDRLKKHEVELCDTRIDGLRIHRFGIPHKSDAASVSSAPERKSAPKSESAPDWNFSMQNFEVKNAVFEYENSERKIVQVWTVKSLRGNRFRTGEVCSVAADASLRIYPDKQNPLDIRALPFRIQADYLLDSDFCLKSFFLNLKTGICDFSIPQVVDIPAKAEIRASVRMEGSFPGPETFRIIRSETYLFKGQGKIGKLEIKGETGRRFQYEGVLSDLDLQPYLSILSPDSKVSMKLPRAEFAVTGSDFSPDGVRNDLKARIVAQMEQISIPVELNRQNRLMRLVLIPLEAMPTFFELINLKWNLQHELNQCINSIQAVISGKQNLNFERARLDVALENSIMQIRNFTLLGKDIEMESIRGTLDLATEKLDIRTILIVSSIKLPLQFKGTLSKPSPYFKEAMKDFVLLNTPFLKKIETLLTEPPSSRDSRLEKAIKRGYRDFHRYLK